MVDRSGVSVSGRAESRFEECVAFDDIRWNRGGKGSVLNVSGSVRWIYVKEDRLGALGIKAQV